MKPRLFFFLTIALVALGLSIQSFAPKPGGDSYTIYVNNKLVLEHFVSMKGQPAVLSLAGYKADDKLVVHYSHCGKTGAQRALQVKNEKGDVLKQWQFGDAGAGMRLQVKDVSRYATGAGPVYLYYASKELQPAMKLAAISGSSALARK